MRRRIGYTKKKLTLFRELTLEVFPFCQWCAEPLDRDSLTVDHITPRSKGGAHHWYNLAGCCDLCNSLKGSHDWGEPPFRPAWFVAELEKLARAVKEQRVKCALWNSTRMVRLNIDPSLAVDRV